MKPPPIPPGYTAPPVIPGQRPSVLPYYRCWCGLFVCLWAGMFVYGVLEFRGVIQPTLGILDEMVARSDESQRSRLVAEKREDAFGVAVVAAVGALFYAAAAFVPRKPWGWIIGLIAIIGSLLPFIITVAGMVPLLIHWVKPEVKRHFQMRP